MKLKLLLILVVLPLIWVAFAHSIVWLTHDTEMLTKMQWDDIVAMSMLMDAAHMTMDMTSMVMNMMFKWYGTIGIRG